MSLKCIDWRLNKDLIVFHLVLQLYLCCSVAELERQLADNSNVLPPVIKELKSDVEKFRERLATTKHLSWLSTFNYENSIIALVVVCFGDFIPLFIVEPIYRCAQSKIRHWHINLVQNLF